MRTKLLNIARRLVVFATGALLVTVGGAIGLAALGWTDLTWLAATGAEINFDPYALPSDVRLIWLAWSCASVLTGVGAIWLAVSLPPRAPRVVLTKHSYPHQFGEVQVTISQRALDALVMHAVEGITGVRECVPRIQLDTNGWTVATTIVADPADDLPGIVAEAKTAIRSRLGGHTGIPVSAISVDCDIFGVVKPQRVK